MEREHEDDYQQLLGRRERMRAERQAAHAAPGRIRLRLGAVVVLIAGLISWLIVSWFTSASSPGEALPEPPVLAEQSAEQPVERPGQSITDSPGAEQNPDTEGRTPAMVHVAGAVEEPQVVEIEAGARIADAVGAAGGLTDDAAAEGVNLAAKAVDGSFIWVPTAEELEAGEHPPAGVSNSDTDGAGTAAAEAPINVNTAGSQELEELSGIGPALAERIITYREANGGFSSLNELAAVSGIGPAVIENIADNVDW